MSGCPRLAEHLAHRRILPVQQKAGDAFRDDYLRGCSGLRSGAGRAEGAVAVGDWVNMAAVARDRARRALGSLGPTSAQVLVAVVVHDRTTGEVADDLGWRSPSVMDVLSAALWQLVRIYAMAPASEVPPPWQRVPEALLEEAT